VNRCSAPVFVLAHQVLFVSRETTTPLDGIPLSGRKASVREGIRAINGRSLLCFFFPCSANADEGMGNPLFLRRK